MLLCSSALMAQPKLHMGSNDPIGTPKGIHPGRVAWTHAPEATTWTGPGNGPWYDDACNDQKKADWMVAEALRSLTGEKNEKAAWKALFRHFNLQHSGKATDYAKGEKIAIKVNMNNTEGYAENGEINASPHLTLALLRSLTKNGKVPQTCITVFDASRYLTDAIYTKCHTEFPNINYVDNVGEQGRTKTGYTKNAIHYSRDSKNMCTGLSTAASEANYLINMAIMKGHNGQGVTLCGKNWYGVTDINKDWHKNSHSNMSQDRQGKMKYITFVDYMGHKDIGGKTMLYFVDALYACRLVHGEPGPKWQMPPFNGNWPCSLLASQDPVAIDCVAMDFLLAEFPKMQDVNYADMYLVEAALADHAPSGTVYDPEGDGTPLNSLGICEHWNNPTDKQYKGIELVYKVQGRK